jgi:hypothetical protein
VLSFLDSDDVAGISGWDTLAAPHSFYASAGWLKYVDGDGISSPTYLAAQDGSDTLACLIRHPTRLENHSLYQYEKALPRLDQAIVHLLGGRRGFHSSVLAADRSRESLNGLGNLIRHATEGAAWWWPYLSADDAVLVREAVGEPLGLHLLNAECIVHLDGKDLDDVADSLPTGQRRNAMRREQRRFERTGAVLRRLRFGDCWRELDPLIHQATSKYGSDLPEERRLAILRRHVEALDDSATVFACFDDGVMTAVSVAFEFGDELAVRLVGFAYDKLRGVGDEYAQVLMYEPMRYCLEKGLRRLNVGMDSFPAKCRRGAVAVPMWAVGTGFGTDPVEIELAARRIADAMPAHEAEIFVQQTAATADEWTGGSAMTA